LFDLISDRPCVIDLKATPDITGMAEFLSFAGDE
jgi:hypothetical protein